MIAGPDVAVMAKQSNWPAAPVGTPDDFEWVNVWAAQAAEPIMSAAERTAARQPGLAAGRPELAVVAGTDVLAPATVDLTPNLDRDVLLAGDLIDIAEARDALEAVLARDRADIPAVTHRRRLAHQAPAVPLSPRAPTPHWLPDAVAAAQQATRRYAKRQYTWFAHQPPADWPRLREPLDEATSASALELMTAKA